MLLALNGTAMICPSCNTKFSSINVKAAKLEKHRIEMCCPNCSVLLEKGDPGKYSWILVVKIFAFPISIFYAFLCEFIVELGAPKEATYIVSIVLIILISVWVIKLIIDNNRLRIADDLPENL